METNPALPARRALRTRLLAERARFAVGPRFDEATAELGQHLEAVLTRMAPQCLGLYWPLQGEFNAPALYLADPALASMPAALPFARRTRREMHYRRWDGALPNSVDECGIAACDGMPVVPDVILVPCVGFTASGLRLGYGGGYFDRWLAANQQAVAVGVAWSFARIDDAQFVAEPHDRSLGCVVTEREVIRITGRVVGRSDGG